MQDDLKQNLLKSSVEFREKLSSLNVARDWVKTNRALEEFYKRPNINITNTSRGLNIKNSMRHIVGSAKYQQSYGLLAEPLGYIKEGWDFLTEPFIYMAQDRGLNYPKYLRKTLNDTLIDLENNEIGRNYVKQNPNITDEDIMQYALNQAFKNYNKQYNTDYLIKLQQNLLGNSLINKGKK